MTETAKPDPLRRLEAQLADVTARLDMMADPDRQDRRAFTRAASARIPLPEPDPVAERRHRLAVSNPKAHSAAIAPRAGDDE